MAYFRITLFNLVVKTAQEYATGNNFTVEAYWKSGFNEFYNNIHKLLPENSIN